MYTVISLYCICSTVQKSCSSQFNICQEARGGFFQFSRLSEALSVFLCCFFTPVCVQGDFQKIFLSHLLLTYESFKHKKAPNSRMNQCSFYTYYTLKQIYLYHQALCNEHPVTKTHLFPFSLVEYTKMPSTSVGQV